MERHPLDFWIMKNLVVLGGMGIFWVVVWQPDYLFIAAGIVFVLASGLFTSKVLLQLHNPWAAFGLAPLFGVGWAGLMWLMSRLV
jgi:hypothetical protein